jgi:tetratricopeptide (TPR) repeat protein
MKSLFLGVSLFAALPLVWSAVPVESATVTATATVAHPAVHFDALEDALAAVRRDPSDPEVQAAAAHAAKEAEQKDRALFHARLAVIATKGDRSFKKLVSEMETIVTELDPFGLEGDEAFNEYLRQLLVMGDAARNRKLWANAVDLYSRAEGTPLDEEAQKSLDKIYSKAEAGEALMKSGLDVPVVGGKNRKSPKWIADFDEKYSEWDKAIKNKSLDVKGYKIRTNMGYEVGEQIGFALTQINNYLRTLYRHKEAGQKLRDCEINVYKSFQDFNEVEFEGKNNPSIGGFFAPGENRISTYDQRTVGRSMDDLWETLFHEASHQFSQDVSKTLQPVWVEEGIACFMEGTVLLPNGAVIPNQIAESRLESLVSMFDQGYDPIRDVITYYAPGSYSGAFYPWGWGLVYFIRNFENENSERIYIEYFDDFVGEYKGEAQHDVWERFVEYFVEKPGVEGIDNFQAWYQQWRSWIRELNDLHFGGPEQADKLIEKARKQVANGKHDYAVETYVWALRKRPGDPVAMLGLAESCLETEREDTAMYYFREILEWCGMQASDDAAVPNAGMKVSELRTLARDEMGKLNRSLADDMVEKTRAFEDQVIDIAGRYVAEGLPLAAALFVQRGQALAGRSYRLGDMAAKLRGEHQADPRIERTLVVDDDLSRWEAFDARLWRKGAGETLVSKPSQAAAIISYLDAPTSQSYRFEATLSLTGESNFPVFGMFYGERVGRSRQIGYIPFEGLCEFRLKGEEPQISEEIRKVFITAGEQLAIAIEVEGNQVEYFIDGESVLTKSYPDSDLKGRVGFFAWNTEITVSDMKLTY